MECPGHFLEIFQPIQGVSFISNSSRFAMEPYAAAIFPNTGCRFETIMKENCFERPTWRGHETQLYKNFIPTKEVLKNVDVFLFDKNVKNFSSMHLRQTDMHAILTVKQRLSDASYDRFVESRPEDEKVYLLSDNPVGQKRFLDKYGDRIIVYKKIIMPSHFVDHRHSSDYWNANQTMNRSNNVKFPVSFRFTSLQHTLIDIIISARSVAFKGSPFSSLSDCVVRFRRILEEPENTQMTTVVKTLSQ